MKRMLLAALACVVALAWIPSYADAQPRTPLFGHRAGLSPSDMPAGTRVFRDINYGPDTRQRMDVYAPAKATDAPVIFMVHGGAWSFGTKNAPGVVENKLKRWGTRGFIMISINYRMLPDAAPLAQADDVAQALAYAQRHAREWGGDPTQFIVMGHSAGAHLVALLTADEVLAKHAGTSPWLGTISLDSAALDVVAVMQQRHLPLYDRAFGSGIPNWTAVSPYQQMHARMVPFLAVCSSRRSDSCPQAQRFVAKASSLGTQAKLLPEDLSHEQINEQLGTPSAYTDSVEAFMRSLSAPVARALSP